MSFCLSARCGLLGIHLCFLFSVLFRFDPIKSGSPSPNAGTSLTAVHPQTPYASSLRLRFYLRNSSFCQTQGDREHVLMQALADTHSMSLLKYNQLKRATEVQMGMEIVHMFFEDLLGRDTAEAKIFHSMTCEE